MGWKPWYEKGLLQDLKTLLCEKERKEQRANDKEYKTQWNAEMDASLFTENCENIGRFC